MAWVKLDDGFYDNRKVVAAGAHGLALWVVGLAYCNRQPQRDGFIPDGKVECLFSIPKVRSVAAKLVEVGLWERVAGGFQIHDYHDFQPNGAKAAEISAKRAEAGRIGGRRSGEARAKQIASSIASGGEAIDTRSKEAKTNPVPVPVELPNGSCPAAAGAASTGQPSLPLSGGQGPGGGAPLRQEAQERASPPSPPAHRRERKQAIVDPRVRPVLRRFAERFQQATGSALPYAPAGGVIKSISTEYSAEQLIALVDRYFDTADEFVRNGGFSVAIFKSRLPALIAASRARGAQRPTTSLSEQLAAEDAARLGASS